MRIPLEPGTLPAIRVPRSKPGEFCIVRQLASGQWTGTCPDYTYRHRNCKHIGRVIAALEERQVA